MESSVDKAITYFRDVLSQHYADFNGRVTRKDYWTYAAVVLGVLVVASILAAIVGPALSQLAALGLFLPNTAMTARRIQDTGKPGSIVWLLMLPVLIMTVVGLLIVIPFGLFGLILFFLPLLWIVNLMAIAAAIYVIYLCIQPGTVGSNAYGPEPMSAT